VPGSHRDGSGPSQLLVNAVTGQVKFDGNHFGYATYQEFRGSQTLNAATLFLRWLLCDKKSRDVEGCQALNPLVYFQGDAEQPYKENDRPGTLCLIYRCAEQYFEKEYDILFSAAGTIVQAKQFGPGLAFPVLSRPRDCRGC